MGQPMGQPAPPPHLGVSSRVVLEALFFKQRRDLFVIRPTRVSSIHIRRSLNRAARVKLRRRLLTGAGIHVIHAMMLYTQSDKAARAECEETLVRNQFLIHSFNYLKPYAFQAHGGSNDGSKTCTAQYRRREAFKESYESTRRIKIM